MTEQLRESPKFGPEETQKSLRALKIAALAFERNARNSHVTGTKMSQRCDIHADPRTGASPVYDIIRRNNPAPVHGKDNVWGGAEENCSVLRGARFHGLIIKHHQLYPAGTFPEAGKDEETPRFFGETRQDQQDMPDEVYLRRDGTYEISLLNGAVVLGTSPEGVVVRQRQAPGNTDSMIQRMKSRLASIIPGVARSPEKTVPTTMVVPHETVVGKLNSMTACLLEATQTVVD